MEKLPFVMSFSWIAWRWNALANVSNILVRAVVDLDFYADNRDPALAAYLREARTREHFVAYKSIGSAEALAASHPLSHRGRLKSESCVDKVAVWKFALIRSCIMVL